MKFAVLTTLIAGASALAFQKGPVKKAVAPLKKAIAPAKKAFAPAKKAFSPVKSAFAPAKKAFAPAKKALAKKAPIGKGQFKNAAKRVVSKARTDVNRIKNQLGGVAFENEVGATLPLGFWDPLGLVADGDQGKFDRLRTVEVKHGRIAMLAVVGYLVQEAGIRLPGYLSVSENLKFSDVPNGYAGLEAIPLLGKLQLFAAIGALEVFVMRDFVGGEFPGDLRNNYIDFGWDNFDESTKQRKRAIEINQGRAAMMGILGLMVHEQLGVSILPSSADPEYLF